MTASPFQFITHRGPQFVEHDVRGFNGTLESVPMGKSQVQALIAEHLKAIDELSGTETVAMIRLPIRRATLADLYEEIKEHNPGEILASKTNGWLRVWKK